jgi:glycosyltransferase involved in cell wall biosynthesis
MASSSCELTILMPCLNEALTLARCIEKAKAFLARSGVKGEVLIADNGSTDGSPALAQQLGARVVEVPVRGYGAALIAGIDAAQGRYVVMGDSDDSYDFSRLDNFLSELRRGAQLVMGNRFQGGILPGAMPALHRYLGNPVLSFIGRLLFRAPIRDFHCGLRGFSRDAIRGLKLRCEGMEFASEMVVKATLNGLEIAQVPTVLSPDGRDRPPHLRSWRDGWRHLRFLLLFSPRWLFLYPGLLLLLAGLFGEAVLLPGPLSLGRLTLDVHTMLYAACAAIAGMQLSTFAVFAKIFAVDQGILPETPLVKAFRAWFSLELGLAFGSICIVSGLALSVYSVLTWDRNSFGALDPQSGMRIVIPALTFVLLGFQVLCSSMFLGVLALRPHGRALVPAER